MIGADGETDIEFLIINSLKFDWLEEQIVRIHISTNSLLAFVSRI
jgi:hypothetical protein